MNSLRQALTSGKGLQEKYLEEKERNEQLESRLVMLQKENAELRASKEIISSTILDSLHKEKEKTSSLEKLLQTRVASRIEIGTSFTPPLPAPPSTGPETNLMSTDSVTPSPKRSMLAELRRMREELRETENASADPQPPNSSPKTKDYKVEVEATVKE